MLTPRYLRHNEKDLGERLRVEQAVRRTRQNSNREILLRQQPLYLFLCGCESLIVMEANRSVDKRQPCSKGCWIMGDYNAVGEDHVVREIANFSWDCQMLYQSNTSFRSNSYISHE